MTEYKISAKGILEERRTTSLCKTGQYELDTHLGWKKTRNI